MSGGGQALRLGPFLGGLNTASDVTAIADAELAVCKNLELDIDGSLVSRPPMQERQGHTSWTERIVCLCEAIFSGVHYVIGSNINGVYQYTGGVWTLITSTFQASAAVQYANKVYLIPKPGSGNGGKWDPVGGFTAVAAIPKGQAAVSHKGRLFIVPGVSATTDTSRLKFSDQDNFDSWPAPNFIDVNQGDGTNLIDLTIFQDVLLLFKSQSTYVLAYDTRPTDAVLKNISKTIGVSRQFNVVNYENQIFISHGGWIYEIINNDFHKVNIKVPFVRDETTPSAFADESIFLTLIEDRLLCRFFKKIYAYDLHTRTWSEWESTADSLQYFGPIVTIHPSTGNEYYSGSCLTARTTTIKFFDKATATSLETAFEVDPFVVDTYTRSVTDDWGSTDTGQSWTEAGGIPSNFSVNGTQGLISLTTVAAARACGLTTVSPVDPDFTISFATDKLATGGNQTLDLMARYVDGSNHYLLQIEFTTTATVVLTLKKVVAGATTTIAGPTTIGSLTHSANTFFTCRFKIQSSQLAGKIWLTAGSQPAAWGVTATDTSLTAPGIVRVRCTLNSGTSNAPVVVKYDNLSVIEAISTTHMINCQARTKNFDLAIPHQFKRLWWWGADVSTNNDVTGIASPIILFFGVTWNQLSAFRWADLANNTWAQPLTMPVSIETIASTGTGVNRRFAKFKKSLRYRQINFEVQLTTEGSIVDGPAKLFTMTIITESKQHVTKQVN